MGEHEDSARRQMERLGIKPKRKKSPPFPKPLRHLWLCFIDLCRGRDDRLTWADMAAWAQLTGTKISAFDADVLMRLEIELRKGLQPKATPIQVPAPK